MKNLSDLKKQAKNFYWTMIKHSWYPTGKLINLKRIPVKINTVGIYLSPLDISSPSFLAWPKSSSLKIEKVDNLKESYLVKITSDCFLTYLLEPII